MRITLISLKIPFLYYYLELKLLTILSSTIRKFTLEEYKKLDPSAEQVPNGILIIQDMNNNDIVITSDQVRTFAATALYMYGNNKLFYQRLIPNTIIEKTIIDGKSVAEIAYKSKEGTSYVFKISDVDIWIAG